MITVILGENDIAKRLKLNLDGIDEISHYSFKRNALFYKDENQVKLDSLFFLDLLFQRGGFFFYS